MLHVHTARQAEGSGDGCENRDSGLDDKPPKIAFILCHNFRMMNGE